MSISAEPEKSSTTSSQGRRLALVVGVNGPSVPNRASLKHAVKDGRDMAQVLQQDGCGFELFHPPLLGEQATMSQVRDAVLDFADHLQEDDFALFFFSGHAEAMLVEAGLEDVYLVTHDFNAARVRRDKNAYLSLSWLRQMLFEHEKAKNILLILDCCYAGKFSDSAPDHYLDELQQRLRYYFGEPGAQNSSRPGGVRLALTATNSGVAQERDGNGLLTSRVLAALRDKCEQAVNGDGQVTFTSLFGYLKTVMPADQQPRFFGAGDELVLATYPDLSIQRRQEQVREVQRADREQRLRSKFANHHGFLQDRLESFVGREQELTEVRQYIEMLLPTGGYLTITGQAGQGKSSIIAKLVDSAAKDQSDLGGVAFHFIPLTPPPDYQVALLQNLMARLVCEYDLSDLFLASESRAALGEGFPRVLKEVTEKGGQEIIFIDGLDQLQEDQHTRMRDLSFLPQGPSNPPPGIVFVLGTRPNDTLRPLELLKPYREYELPNLSRSDFNHILQHRGVVLERTLADRFYETLDKNALYLDLVAKELAARRDISSQEVEEIVRQIADDPENLFSLTIDRLRRQEALWTVITKPLLGLLLVTNEPLAREHLKSLLNLSSTVEVDGEQLNQGLERLGGLVVIDERQRYNLFHLKFREYLHQDRQNEKKKYVFDTEDEQRWHKRFIAWCEQNGLDQIWEDTTFNAIEQGRRSYAREHYITHLYYAGNQDKLLRTLDEGVYGKAKVKHDPGMRSYALDLDLGRKVLISAQWQLEEAIYHLPYLWRYTLLRCSLASRADKYPREAFTLMLLLGQEAKVLGLAELLTNPEYKSQIFTLIACHLAMQPERLREALQIFLRAERVILSISDERSKVRALAELGIALKQAEHWQEAERVILSISDERSKARALAELGTALKQAGRWQEAEQCWQEAECVILSISDERSKASALVELGAALGRAGHWQEAERVVLSISDEWSKVRALEELGTALRRAGCWQEAERVILFIADKGSKAEALTKLGTTLRQAGYWQEAKRHWKKAEQVISSILYTEQKLEVLTRFGKALGQAGHWQEAERVILSISNEGSKARALEELGAALRRAERWQEAERVILSTSDKRSKAQGIRSLAAALAQYNDYSRIINIVQREWFQTGSRGSALDLFPPVLSLVLSYPKLGVELYRSFVWVDGFLQG